MLFRPKEGFFLEKSFHADDFLSFYRTQSDTSRFSGSFALGYQYFAHTGLKTITLSAFSKLFVCGVYFLY